MSDEKRPAAKADERELYVVEYVGYDDVWGPDPGDCHLYRELAEEHAEERRDAGDGDTRVTRYLPEDPAALVRAKLEVLEDAIGFISDEAAEWGPDHREFADVALEYLREKRHDLRRQLTATDSGGKGTS